jgi:hypothetical protein
MWFWDMPHDTVSSIRLYFDRLDAMGALRGGRDSAMERLRQRTARQLEPRSFRQDLGQQEAGKNHPES